MDTLAAGTMPLYEARLSIGGSTEFGYPLEALRTRAAPVPPSGARFDVAFDGPIEGENLTGHVTGVDHVLIRADGRMELHLHGRIVTTDGASISFSGSGVAVADPATGLFQLYDSATLQTADSRYLWVNGLPIWGIGALDLPHGEIRVTGYTSPTVAAASLHQADQ